MTSSCAILAIFRPAPTGEGGVQMMKILWLLATMIMIVELTSETWCELVNSQATHHVVLYRIKIRNDLT